MTTVEGYVNIEEVVLSSIYKLEWTPFSYLVSHFHEIDGTKDRDKREHLTEEL